MEEYWHRSRYLKRLLSDNNSMMKTSTRDNDVFILDIKRIVGNWKNRIEIAKDSSSIINERLDQVIILVF